MNQTEGRNPVLEALKANRVIRIKVAKEVLEEKKIRRILEFARTLSIPVELVNISLLEDISQTHHHQGVIALIRESETQNLRKILRDRNNDLCFVVLEYVQDPRNLGSILRTAESSGTSAVIIPKRKSVGLTPIVHRTSMGGSLYVPLVEANLYSLMKMLRKEDISIIGIDPSGSIPYFFENLTGSVAFIFGGEDRGISSGLLSRCNSVVNIPMEGRLESLNVSVSTSLILYERLRQRYIRNNCLKSN